MNIHSNRFEHNGVKVLSTAMLTDDTSKPIVWRGPLIAKMVGDFLRNTEWGELDFLIIDLPPGTSDVPLSIMQLLNLTGFILVTTPQHIAAVNTIRSGTLVKKVQHSVAWRSGKICQMALQGAEKRLRKLLDVSFLEQ